MIALAIRYLLAKKRQTFLTLLGIFLGTTAFIVVSGFFLGYSDFLIDKLVNNTPHIHILPREDFHSEHSLDKSFFSDTYKHVFWQSPPSGRRDRDRIENPRHWYASLSADPRVEAFSPVLSTGVVFSKTKFTVLSTVIGCDPIQQPRVTNLSEYFVAGSFDELATGNNRIIAGTGLLKRLGARVADVIYISLPQGDATTIATVPFKVVGAFTSGIKSVDLQAFATIADVQRIKGAPSQVNGIAVRLKNYSDAAPIARAWAALGFDRVESWDQQNQSLLSIFLLQDLLRYLMIAAVLIVASFGIYNVLNMTVTQKRKDIAILKSMGYGTYEVVFLFFSQGVILGVLGALLGAVVGYLICFYLQTLDFSPSAVGGATAKDQLHISLSAIIYMQAGLLAILSTSLASIFPALAAGRLTPIEIIRAGAE